MDCKHQALPTTYVYGQLTSNSALYSLASSQPASNMILYHLLWTLLSNYSLRHLSVDSKHQTLVSPNLRFARHDFNILWCVSTVWRELVEIVVWIERNEAGLLPQTHNYPKSPVAIAISYVNLHPTLNCANEVLHCFRMVCTQFNSIQFYLYSAITIQLSLGALQSPDSSASPPWGFLQKLLTDPLLFLFFLSLPFSPVCVWLCVCLCVCIVRHKKQSQNTNEDRYTLFSLVKDQCITVTSENEECWGRGNVLTQQYCLSVWQS